ncbi:MAG: hypothetical protein RRY65_04685, partial [Pseudoflavonifractor sp.]
MTAKQHKGNRGSTITVLPLALFAGACLVLTTTKKHQIRQAWADEETQQNIDIQGFTAIDETTRFIVMLTRNEQVVGSIPTTSSK